MDFAYNDKHQVVSADDACHAAVPSRHYTCVKCHDFVHLRNGYVRKAHFAHSKRDETTIECDLRTDYTGYGGFGDTTKNIIDSFPLYLKQSGNSFVLEIGFRPIPMRYQDLSQSSIKIVNKNNPDSTRSFTIPLHRMMDNSYSYVLNFVPKFQSTRILSMGNQRVASMLERWGAFIDFCTDNGSFFNKRTKRKLKNNEFVYNGESYYFLTRNKKNIPEELSPNKIGSLKDNGMYDVYDVTIPEDPSETLSAFIESSLLHIGSRFEDPVVIWPPCYVSGDEKIVPDKAANTYVVSSKECRGQEFWSEGAQLSRLSVRTTTGGVSILECDEPKFEFITSQSEFVTFTSFSKNGNSNPRTKDNRIRLSRDGIDTECIPDSSYSKYVLTTDTRSIVLVSKKNGMVQCLKENMPVFEFDGSVESINVYDRYNGCIRSFAVAEDKEDDVPVVEIERRMLLSKDRIPLPRDFECLLRKIADPETVRSVGLSVKNGMVSRELIDELRKR